MMEFNDSFRTSFYVSKVLGVCMDFDKIDVNYEELLEQRLESDPIINIQFTGI